jgi:hypothetical protein
MKRKIYINEKQLKKIVDSASVDKYKLGNEGNSNLEYGHVVQENYMGEVESDEIDLTSFKKQHELCPKIWDNGNELKSEIRLKLMDIADDFWKGTNVTWVKPTDYILTGSICNYNWSKYSDIDLHIVVDFSKVDKRKNFVQEFFDAKKNEYNDEHDKLTIYGFPVELYVQDINADTESKGIFSLYDDEWIIEPSYKDIGDIYTGNIRIKETAAKIMTKIDDLCDEAEETDDSVKLEHILNRAYDLKDKIYSFRKDSLKKNGEMSFGNIVFKCIRRSEYTNKLFDLISDTEDKINSIY